MRGKMKEHGHARVAAVPQVRTDEIMMVVMGGASGPPVAFPPSAAFTSDVTIGALPLTVQFTDQSSGNPHTWAWGFGDTGSSTQQNPSHVYADPGVYTVSLTVTNDEGSDTETKDSYITVAVLPVAEFSGVPLSGESPLSVQFTDESTGVPTSWAWDFGDTNTSTEQNPLHEYANDGTYTVSLTATNDMGADTETKVDYISASAAQDDWWLGNGTIDAPNVFEHVETPSIGQLYAGAGIPSGPWTIAIITTADPGFSSHYTIDSQNGRVIIGRTASNNGYHVSGRWHDVGLFDNGDASTERVYFLIHDGVSSTQSYRENTPVGSPDTGGVVMFANGGSTRWRSAYNDGSSTTWPPELIRAAVYDIALSSDQRTQLAARMHTG